MTTCSDASNLQLDAGIIREKYNKKVFAFCWLQI